MLSSQKGHGAKAEREWQMTISVSETGGDKLAAVQQNSWTSDPINLTPEQQELLRDMRVSLKQMRRGETIPAREALHEIGLELEAEADASRSDT